jgi:hypothetical protein
MRAIALFSARIIGPRALKVNARSACGIDMSGRNRYNRFPER